MLVVIGLIATLADKRGKGIGKYAFIVIVRTVANPENVFFFAECKINVHVQKSRISCDLAFASNPLNFGKLHNVPKCSK